MALPVDDYISSALRTTGEFKVGLDDIVTDAARGNPEYTSTRTFEKGAKVKASNDIVFTSMIDGNVGNTPQADDGSNWYASVFDNVLGSWADKTGAVFAGSGLYHNGVLWRVEVDITDVTLSEPIDNNASYSKSAGGAVFDFVVSQYAGGDKTKVSYIKAGLALAAYEWFVDKNTLQVFSKNGATGTFSDPLDFDPATGIDTGVAGALLNKSITGVDSRQFAIGTTPQLAELTNTGATFTDGTPRYRVGGVTYTNNETYPLHVSLIYSGTTVNVLLSVNGVTVNRALNNGTGAWGVISHTIPPSGTYATPSAIGTLVQWTEDRK